MQRWNAGPRGPNQRKPAAVGEEDEFDRMVREKKEEEQKKSNEDQKLAAKVAELADQLEHDDRNYSDIDRIFEKNAKQRNAPAKAAIVKDDDDAIDDLFASLRDEEEKRQETRQHKPQTQTQHQAQQV